MAAAKTPEEAQQQEQAPKPDVRRTRRPGARSLKLRPSADSPATVATRPLGDPLQDVDGTDAIADEEISASNFPPATPWSEQLAIDNQKLARSRARRMSLRTKFAPEELMLPAWLGLLRAARTFDPDRGLRFSTFAVFKIDGAMKQWLRDYGYAVKFPHAWREHAPKIRGLAQQGRSAEEIAREVGVDRQGKPLFTPEEVRELLHVTRQFKHWDEVVGFDSEPRVKGGRDLEAQEFEEASELSDLYDLAARAWRRMDEGDQQAIAAAWDSKRRNVPGHPLGQFAAQVKRLVGPHKVRGETELAPLGFPLLCGLRARGDAATSRPPATPQEAAAALTHEAEQLALGLN